MNMCFITEKVSMFVLVLHCMCVPCGSVSVSYTVRVSVRMLLRKRVKHYRKSADNHYHKPDNVSALSVSSKMRNDKNEAINGDTA